MHTKQNRNAEVLKRATVYIYMYMTVVATAIVLTIRLMTKSNVLWKSCFAFWQLTTRMIVNTKKQNLKNSGVNADGRNICMANSWQIHCYRYMLHLVQKNIISQNCCGIFQIHVPNKFRNISRHFIGLQVRIEGNSIASFAKNCSSRARTDKTKDLNEIDWTYYMYMYIQMSTGYWNKSIHRLVRELPEVHQRFPERGDDS